MQNIKNTFQSNFGDETLIIKYIHYMSEKFPN